MRLPTGGAADIEPQYSGPLQRNAAAPFHWNISQEPCAPSEELITDGTASPQAEIGVGYPVGSPARGAASEGLSPYLKLSCPPNR